MSETRSARALEIGDTEIGDTEIGDTEIGDTEIGDTEIGDTAVEWAGSDVHCLLAKS